MLGSLAVRIGRCCGCAERVVDQRDGRWAECEEHWEHGGRGVSARSAEEEGIAVMPLRTLEAPSWMITSDKKRSERKRRGWPADARDLM